MCQRQTGTISSKLYKLFKRVIAVQNLFDYLRGIEDKTTRKIHFVKMITPTCFQN